MKFKVFGLLFCFNIMVAQSVPKPLSAIKFSQSKTSKDRINNSFVTAEYYLENDDIESSQKWLNITKDILNPSITDSTDCYVHSLQSELFYYNGLFQFGKDEARKEIMVAQKINDKLLLADAYFFLGINQFELGEYNDAMQSLWFSRNVFPKQKLPKSTL